MDQLQRLAVNYLMEGFWNSYYRLRDKGEQVNLLIESDYNLKIRRMIWVLTHLVARYIKPEKSE